MRSRAAATTVIVDLGTLPGGTFSSTVAVNEQGMVAGIADDANGAVRVVRWSGFGDVTALPLPDWATFASAATMNEQGVVVGIVQDAELNTHATLWNAAGAPTMLAALPGGTYTNVNGINDDGTVVGYGDDAAGQTRPIRWRPDGAATVLDTSPIGSGGQAVAINDNGTIVGFTRGDDGRPHALRWSPGGAVTDLGVERDTIGTNNRQVVIGQALTAHGVHHAVRWKGDVVTDLVASKEFATSRPAAVNDDNVAVGSADLRPVKWTTTGDLVELATLPGDVGGFTADINASGAVIGTSGDGFLVAHPVRWDASGAVTALPGLPGADNFAWVNDLNDQGVIVGNARTAAGGFHGVRWQ